MDHFQGKLRRQRRLEAKRKAKNRTVILGHDHPQAVRWRGYTPAGVWVDQGARGVKR